METQDNDDLTRVRNAADISLDEVVDVLVKRYEQRPRAQTYTNIGDRMLIALNPNESNDESSDQTALRYVDDYRDTTDGRQELAPHVFKVAEQAYLHMRRTGLSQSISFIGASGSGKTEQRRLATRLLSLVRAQSKRDSRLYARMQHADIVLEAFSHAKTATHSNASRVGSYVEVQFDERGRATGAKMLPYMLEKSRVTHVPQGERGFHVFYYLAQGASGDERAELGITQAAYDYLQRPGTVQRVSGVDDGSRLGELTEAMGGVGLGQRHQRHVFRTLAAILALGNVQFQAARAGGDGAATVRNQDVADQAGELLGVAGDALAALLTAKTTQVGSDKFTVYLDGDGAAARRDDLARALYALVFNWVAEFVNARLARDDADGASVIAMVDFPGWAAARHSGYEQLCANYASERLHHFVFHQVFEAGSGEYAAEGLGATVPAVAFADRSACLDLFMRPRTGLFATLDRQAAEYLQLDRGARREREREAAREFDAGAAPREAAAQLLKAFNRQHDRRGAAPNAFYAASGSKNDMNSFTVAHFWGDVSYAVDDFVDKNLDQLSADFVAAFRGDGSAESPGSASGFVAGLFSSKTLATEVHPRDASAVVQAQAPSVPTRAPSTRRPATRGATRIARVDCVATQLQRALNELVATLDDTLPWFVVCVRPNEQGRARAADARRVQAQAACFALDAAVRRKAADFSAVLAVADFVQRYAAVIAAHVPDAAALPDDAARCEALRRALQLRAADMALGRSKVFLSFAAWRRIDDPVRAAERSGLQRDAGALADAAAYADPADSLAPSYGDQSEAQLVLHAQPPGSDAAAHVRALKGRLMGGGADVRSYYSDDDAYGDAAARDAASELGTERNFGAGYADSLPPSLGGRSAGPSRSASAAPLAAAHAEPADEPDVPATRARKLWVAFTWLCTWAVPSPFLTWCGRIKRRDQRMAWREKVALCMIIFWSCAFVVFWIVALGLILCPRQHVYSLAELTSHNTAKDALIAVRGEVFDIKDYTHMGVQFKFLADRNYLGVDQSALFPYQLSFVCQFPDMDPRLSFQFKPKLYTPAYYHDHRWWRHPTEKGYNYYQFRLMRTLRENFSKGHIAVDPKELLKQGEGISKDYLGKNLRRCIIHDEIYDLTEYIAHQGVPYLVSDTQNSTNSVGTRKFLDNDVYDMFDQNPGQDITEMWDRHFANDPASKALHTNCLRGAFYVGKVDQRKSARCYAANYLLLAASIALVSVIFFKFVAALQFGSRRDPEPGKNFVICNVPCYTEGEESLRHTIDSLAQLKYDDKRKLLFIVCDGMIMGSGNDRPTPRIVLDILGVTSDQEPEALSYIALGEGSKEHNMAKVYSGLYEFKGHVVPYLVIVKCGLPQERNRPGNRGKRDSQILLMRFFNKVYFDLPMTPLELEMYHQIKNVIGVNPALYEFVLMIDADTVVFPDSLSRLIGSMNNDIKIIGICGETTLANAKSSWITMMQVYEYFISHHLTKAFESLFGSVSCLPGCFCMYRLRTPENTGTSRPLLISNQIIEDYSTNRVETLHEKNLLHLGEDRYLTTLVLKHFPYYKNKFTPSAKCMTNAPDQLSILLSQRRRWINSTVHNLFELVFLPQLCGFCCFSMRFVVFIDLITTIIMPATVVYLAYLIYQLTNPDSTTSYISLYLLAAIYGMQALIFILKRQWQHIGWMIVYILAIPLFSFLIPIYSFWHFDDFSWGNTRVVIGESGRKHVYTVDNEKFDKSSIPVRKWSDYEQELLDDPKSQYAMSETGSRFGGPAAAAAINRPGSAIGNVPQSMAGYANTNSVYNDNGYGYSTMLNSNLPMVAAPGIPGTNFDFMASGRSSPVQPMLGANGMPNAYEMSPIVGPGGFNQARMSTVSSVMDPRISQAGAMPYFQQAGSPMVMPDPRLSTAYSMGQPVASSPMMVPQQAFVMNASSRPASYAVGNDQMTIQMNPLDAGVGQNADYSAMSVPQSGSPIQQNHQQWPSGAADEHIAARVAEIIATTDLMTITKKQVRQQVMDNFGISADEEKARRDFINQCIAQELEKRQSAN
ncbi:hypothetical protein GGI15_000193 [Coemansia interrupta]|uniref:chitin synthase n=1 Tax=Coemansia interrupta TaxID=1126814 RepID=A0A9W8HML3_9FUNG|nr:hypothetical protein GGI15_000193 [Coemansia interrupta]